MRIQLATISVLAVMAAGLTAMPAHAVNCEKNPDHPKCDGGGSPPGGGGNEEEGPFIVVELGALGGEYSTARDINEQDQITGGAYDTDGVEVAVIWTMNPDDGSISTVGLPGLQGDGDCGGQAINNLGSVVGFCIDAFGKFRAVHWDASGEMTDLEDVYGMDLSASDINDAGQIVAIENVPTPPGQEEPELDRTFVLDLDNGPPTRIAAPFVYGFGINLAGQVVGQSDGRVPNDPRPLWWTKVGGADTVIELGFLSETGWAQAINDEGLIVGGDGSDVQQPIMWTVGANGGVVTIQGLGTLGGSRGWATDVNNAGQVVGATTTKKGKRDSEHRFAFFWENGQFTKLDMLKRFSHKSDAVALNDGGLVAGNVYNSTHRSKAIVWVPR